MQQATNALLDMQATMRLSPSSVSIENQQSTMALYNAARTAFERMTAGKIGGMPQSGDVGRQPAGSTRTVNINVGGRSTPVNLASQADSDALVGVLRQLESARGSAA